MTLTRLIIGFVVLSLFGACASSPESGGGIQAPNPEDAIQTATGTAQSANTDKELEVQTGVSQEGNVSQSSADVRNQEDTQATTSGHIQTLGFAGIGNAADIIKGDPVMTSILAEIEVIMKTEPLDTARLDALRAQMVERSKAITAAVAATTPSFDGLKTIVAIFSMENQTGHEKTPLSDTAAGHKADAFKAALSSIQQAAAAETKAETKAETGPETPPGGEGQ